MAVAKSFSCVLTKMSIHYNTGYGKEKYGCEYNGKIYDIDMTEGENEPFNAAAVDHKVQEFRSGESILTIPESFISDGIIKLSNLEKVRVESKSKILSTENAHSCRNTCGNKTVVAIRVISADNETSSSLSDLRENLFGFGDDEVNLVSQFTDCSHGKLNFVPFQGHTETQQEIIGGVGEVTIPFNSTSIPSSLIREDVLSAAKEKYGNLTSQFDYVMLCLPPKTLIGSSSDWIGYAFVNSWLSVFNDHWCDSPTAQLHELGHNLGLEHSDPDYGDESCIMGYSYNEDEGPKMCFNGAKSWQLGWYADSLVTINATALHRWDERFVSLTGVSDYNRRGDTSSIVQIVGIFDDFEYYIAFNRKSGANSGTGEGGDKILVTKRPTGQDPADSHLVAELDIDEEYYIFNSDDRSQTKVKVETINLLLDPAIASISISRYSEICYADDYCFDDNACTVDYCDFSLTQQDLPGAGICKNDEMACEACGSTFNLRIDTNSYPELVSWSILNVDKDFEVKFGNNYTKQFSIHDEKFCLEFGNYKVLLNDDSTFKNHPQYIARMQGKTFYQTTDFQIGSLSTTTLNEISFGVSCNSEDCIDYDGCTLDVFDPITRLCTFQPLSECLDCKLAEINITLDNFPDQTSWSLTEAITGKLLVSGGPYPSFGRRKAPTTSGRRILHSVRKLISRELLYEFPNVYETKCLENQNAFEFTMYDTFGDGICCYEGVGNYTVSLDGNVIFSGGEYDYLERKAFSTKSCANDLLEIYVQLDNDSALVTWGVWLTATAQYHAYGTHNDPVGSFISDEFCESFTSTAYFKILRANGLCCSNGNGYYYLLLNGVEIRRGAVFTDEEKTFLVPNSRMLLDYSASNDKFANNFKGSESRNTDLGKSYLASNRISSLSSNCPAIPGVPPTSEPSSEPSRGPSNVPSFIPSMIPSTIPSNYPSDTPSSSPSNNPSNIPSTSISPSSIPSTSANPSIHKSEVPSSWPSEVPSSFPSLSPSSEPSMYVETVDFRDDWGIVLNEDSLHNKSVDALQGFEFQYYISKVHNEALFVATIYDEFCVSKKNDTAIFVFNITVQEFQDENYDLATVRIKVNHSLIEGSSYWEETSSIADISYCVKCELLFENDKNLSVSFFDTRVDASIDLFTNFIINDVKLQKKNISAIDQEMKMKLNACICDDLHVCLESPVLMQNTPFSICITPEKDAYFISEFENIFFYQGGILKLAPVVEGEINVLAVVTTGNTGIIETRLTSVFFDLSNPADLFISGEAKLGFTAGRGLKEENFHTRNLENEDKVSFNLTVELKTKERFLARHFYMASIVCVIFVASMFSLMFSKKRKYFGYSSMGDVGM